MDLLADAKTKGYAIPAVNCVTSSSINSCLEAARANDAPIMIQFSSGGSQFYAGKGLDNSNYQAAIAGAVSGAFHVRTLAEQYGVPVVLHTDHAGMKLLPWVDGLLDASERYYEKVRGGRSEATTEGKGSVVGPVMEIYPIQHLCMICDPSTRRLGAVIKRQKVKQLPINYPEEQQHTILPLSLLLYIPTLSNNLLAVASLLFPPPQHGEPLFSSHMIDLSEEPIEENIAICEKYLARMSKMGMVLEMELGVTGGEEDGVNNEDVAKEDLYSKPEEIYEVYQRLSKISDKFTIAAAFGNVHGVYAGDIDLDPEILNKAQEYISSKLGSAAPADKKPAYFVFHGGSGSELADIRKAISYGTIKMNIDTDTQWSYWEGIKNFEDKFHPYLQSQIGNPDGPDKPNKKYYDPRESLRAAEVNTVKRLGQAYDDLKCKNILGLPPMKEPENTLGPRRGGLPV